MAGLKTKKQTFFVVDYSTLDSFIREVYGQEFEFLADQEAGNDSTHQFWGVKKEQLDRYDTEKLEKFKETGYYSFLTTILLTDLCNQGLIEEGNYLIEVCW